MCKFDRTADLEISRKPGGKIHFEFTTQTTGQLEFCFEIDIAVLLRQLTSLGVGR